MQEKIVTTILYCICFCLGYLFSLLQQGSGLDFIGPLGKRGVYFYIVQGTQHWSTQYQKSAEY